LLASRERVTVCQVSVHGSGNSDGGEELARAILVSVPSWERVPPLILRPVTRLRHANPAITLQRYAHAIVVAFMLTRTDASR
jgi:hypothetical protein